MKNALIIDDEKSLLFSIKKGFETFKIVDLNLACVNIAELGALASDMLRKAQTAAEVTGFGRSQLVYFET